VAWIENNLLKGRSFWQVSIPHNCSWSWRKLLKLRSIAKQFLSFKVGDDRKIFLWYDVRHPEGCLFDKYGYRMIYDAGSAIGPKVYMYKVGFLKSILAERIFLFGGLQMESTLVLRPGITFDKDCQRFNGISLSGFLWQSLNILLFFGWCLGMFLLPRKRCALGVTRVLSCVSFVSLVRKIETTSFSGVVSAGVFGGVLWLNV